MMELRNLQTIVDEWINNVGNGYFSELTNMAILTEETGEVARLIARIYGDQRPKDSELPGTMRNASLTAKKNALKPKLAEEIADLIWVAVCIANQTGIDLEEAILNSLEKKTKRDASRFSQSS